MRSGVLDSGFLSDRLDTTDILTTGFSLRLHAEICRMGGQLCRTSAHGWAAGCPLARACHMAWVPGKEPSGANASLDITLKLALRSRSLCRGAHDIYGSLLVPNMLYEAVDIDLMSDIVSESV